MNNRSTAMTLAVVLLIALFGVAFLAPMPYVLLSPGPTENTLGAYGGHPVIAISGHKTYPTSGHLNLTTVSETRADYSVRLPQVLDAWWSSDKIVIPRDVVYPPNQSVAQVEHQNTQEMLDSQSMAVVAGLGEAGIKATDVSVTTVIAGTPAEGVLRVGDQIVSVNGKVIDTLADASAAISSLKPGSRVTLNLVRSGLPTSVSLSTVAIPQDPSHSRVGVTLTETYNPPFKVDINLGQDIGGPSAGTMFSLAIYDKITPGSLTGGRFVAGTGTIDEDGNVGEIGGIQQKIAGAYAAGARVFLVPAANCAEAAGSSLAGKIELIKISTLSQAVASLKALDAGNTAGVSGCGS